jgi:ubiquinone/menaquinone biosynthesis C-methylase UbiE
VPASDWEREAENWVRWARTPGHDAYWFYAPGFFEETVPPPGRRTLDLGCGEGRSSRDLLGRGHHVVAMDSSPTLVAFAAAADSRGDYVVADATSMPFPSEGFDVVVAYNSLMDVDDMPAAVLEAARVLEPKGYFCVSVTHPLGDSGAFRDTEPNAPFIIRKSYLEKRRFEETFERNGLQVTFRGWCYPLEAYARAMESAGFLIEQIREPRADEKAITSRASYVQWQRVPMFLQLRAIKAP